MQITFEYLHFQQRCLNVIHYYVNEAGTGTQEDCTQEVANHFGSVLAGKPAGNILSLLPVTVNLVRVRAQLIAPIRYAYFTDEVNTAGSRESSDTANINAVVTKRTVLAGDDQKGNFFLPGIAPDDMADGLLTNAFQSDILEKLDFLTELQIGAGNTWELSPVIFHPSSGLGTEIYSILVHPEVRVLTRRTVGRGE